MTRQDDHAPDRPAPGHSRPDVSLRAATAEATTLREVLRDQRAHVIRALEGLSEAFLHHPVLPSGWSPLGLVQHLTLDVERFWFRSVIAGEMVELATGDQAWRVAPDVPARRVLAAYQQEAVRSDAIIADRDLGSRSARWPSDVFKDLPERNLREIMLNVLAETACHAGHLDVVRELHDGRQHLVLT